MPTAYEELLLDARPQVIESREQYEEVLGRVGQLMRQGRSRAPEVTKLLRLLSLLIQDYDRRHALPPEDLTPAERLQYVLEASGKSPAELLAIFGQRSHVNEAINGKRSISAAQARKLGELFKMNPGYFL
jgi:antitoxin component HigA of HigAB toxin-antitoxin module